MKNERVNQQLIKYARVFLNSRPDLANKQIAEQAAAFAAQLRAGCMQDLERLMVKCIEDTPSGEGKDRLAAFCGSVIEGGEIELWGMPDCICKKPGCVYCSRGLGAAHAGGGTK